MLNGALGSMTLKFDKSVPANGITFYLKALTKGLVSAEQ